MQNSKVVTKGQSVMRTTYKNNKKTQAELNNESTSLRESGEKQTSKGTNVGRSNSRRKVRKCGDDNQVNKVLIKKNWSNYEDMKKKGKGGFKKSVLRV